MRHSLFRFIFGILLFISTACSNPEKELPPGTLTLNDWFIEEGNPNSRYDAQITLSFSGSGGKGTASAWEGSGFAKSCTCDGMYELNASRNQLTISGFTNSNCPWMNSLNGVYSYVYDGSRDGYNKFMFQKGSILVTHMFQQNR